MCGIAGIFGGSAGVEPETVRRMADALAHRGPDDEGVWVDAEARIGLGHRRLAIVDLSEAGHQPMQSPGGRYLISFNGEIYNHADLRARLRAEGREPQWRGHSDTETLLASVEAWGVNKTLRRASGMFALALWDRSERELILARDRLGEKPLYYGRANGPQSAFLFASELKSLHRYPEFQPEIDREALGLLVRYLAIPAPHSIYRGISKLLPGSMLTLRSPAAEPMVDRYWSGAEVARSGVENPITSGPEAVADELEQVLERAVGRQMMSDVPLGAFLSGGCSSDGRRDDAEAHPRPVKTFTVGFHESAFNEADQAKAVASHLGTDHSELYVSASEAAELIPAFRKSSTSRLPTSANPDAPGLALTRGHVTVSLSGDGGDELFGGYDRYLLTNPLWDRINRSRPLRAETAREMTLLPARPLTAFGDKAQRILPGSARVSRLGDKVHKGAATCPARALTTPTT